MQDEIIKKTRQRIDNYKKTKSLEEIKIEVSKLKRNEEFPFKKDSMLIIPEINISNMDYMQIAKEYGSLGVNGFSLLISSDCDDFIHDIHDNINLPVIANDFIIDEYLIWKAKILGFSSVFLKLNILDVVDLKRYYDLAHSLGLGCVLEVHDSSDISKALIVGGDIICVNDSNIENIINLRRCVSQNTIFIAKSCIKSKEDIIKLKENNVNAIILNDSSIKIHEISPWVDEI